MILTVRVSLALAAVGVVAAWMIWGAGVAILVLAGSVIGLLFGSFWRTLTEPVEDRVERYRGGNDRGP